MVECGHLLHLRRDLVDERPSHVGLADGVVAEHRLARGRGELVEELLAELAAALEVVRTRARRRAPS